MRVCAKDYACICVIKQATELIASQFYDISIYYKYYYQNLLPLNFVFTITALKRSATCNPISYQADDGSTIIFNVFSGGTMWFGHYIPPKDTEKYPCCGTYDTKEYLSVVAWTASLENLPTPDDGYKYTNNHTVVNYAGQFAKGYTEINTSYTVLIKSDSGDIKPEIGTKNFKLIQ